MPDFGGPPERRSGTETRSIRIDYAVLHQVKNSHDAVVVTRTHHEHIFDDATGGEYHVRKRALDEANERCVELHKELREIDKRLRTAPQWIDAPSAQGGEPGGDVPFRQWRMVDRAATLLSASAASALLAMGAANVTVNLLNSGNETFITQPWSAALFGSIVPGTAIAAEGIHHFIRSNEVRRFYILGMFGSGLAAAGVWIFSFAQEFQGVSTGIDWDALAGAAASGGHGGARLVWTQILAEIFLGAGLFMTIDQISRKYWRGTRVQSTEWIELSEARKRCVPECERADACGREENQAFVRINAARERFVGQALAALSAIKNS